MTAKELAARLTDDIRRIEAATPRHSAHRAVVVHCIEETVRWMAQRTPQPPQGAAQEGEAT